MAKKEKFVEPRINDEIRGFNEVRVIGEGIENGKVCSLSEAKSMALKQGLDLVEISPTAKPPVVKIINYSKYLFERRKQLKKINKNTTTLKEIQLSVNISPNDIETKVKQAKKFIAHGDKVKVVLTMKGRELSRREESKKSLYLFIVSMEEVASIEGQLQDDNNRCTCILKKK